MKFLFAFVLLAVFLQANAFIDSFAAWNAVGDNAAVHQYYENKYSPYESEEENTDEFYNQEEEKRSLLDLEERDIKSQNLPTISPTIKGCLKCIHYYREQHGKTIKQAKSICNCKRELEDEEAEAEVEEPVEESDEAEKRAAISPAIKGCLRCVSEQRKLNKKMKEAVQICGCKREFADESIMDEAEKRGAKDKSCLDCISKKMSAKTNKMAYDDAKLVCKCKREFDEDDMFEARNIKMNPNIPTVSPAIKYCLKCINDYRTLGKSIKQSKAICKC